VSESDDEERFREREETKRLMYVALTRARDRLYLGTVLKDGNFAMGRGSLADVLPESVRGLFVRAAQEAGESIAWTAESGRAYQFRRVATPCGASRASAFSTAEASAKAVRPKDFFEPLTDPDAVERVAVTDALEPVPAGPADIEPAGGEDEALVGTLVHRLFQFAGELPVPAGAQDVTDLAIRLIRPEERATAASADASVSRAIGVWTAMRTRPGVSELFESGERMHELPFSCRLPAHPQRVVRGTIDCLIRRPDGTIVVIELKTGAPAPVHQAQLDIYLEAARAMFPGTVVEGRIVYPR
jgi:ATP-dependent helicase/nuclease subunit A